MESWELDFEWLQVRHYVKSNLDLNSLPDLKGILFMMGLQEFGNWLDKRSFTKEEKRDLMHVATCALLEPDGYYEFSGRDQDGWPHYRSLKPFTVKGVNDQEYLLKTKVIEYFKRHQAENLNIERLTEEE